MTELEIANFNMIFMHKPQKYQHYHLENQINMYILEMNKLDLIILLLQQHLKKKIKQQKSKKKTKRKQLKKKKINN